MPVPRVLRLLVVGCAVGALGCVRPLPDELSLLVLGEPSLAPGESAEPVEVRVVCQSCPVDALDDYALEWGRPELPTDRSLVGTFAPAQATWSNQLVVSAAASARRGTSRDFVVTLVRKGTRTIARTAVVTTHVSGADFSLAAEPAALSVPPGGLGAFRVRVARAQGFTGAVSLAVPADVSLVDGGASGASAELLDGDETGDTRLVLLRANSAAADAELRVRVRGSSATSEQLLEVPASVESAAEGVRLTLSVSPPGLLVPRGASRSARVQLRASSARSLDATLAVTGLPSGVTAQLSPSSLTVAGDGGVAMLDLRAEPGALPRVSTPRVVAVVGAVAVEFGFVLTVPGTPSDAGVEPDEDGGEADGGALDGGGVDGGALDAGAGPNLLRCECGDLTFRGPVCTPVTCVGTAQLTDECARVCGDAGTYMHQCTEASPQCGATSSRDAGPPEGTTEVLCDCNDGLPPLRVCADLSCNSLFTVVLQTQRCATACGGSGFGVASTRCTSNALVCGGDGGAPPGNGFYCACADGRRTGVCGGRTSCTVAPPFLPVTCPEFCDGGAVQQLDCLVEHFECQPGVTTFPWDAGVVDAGPFDAGPADAGPPDAGVDAGRTFAWGVVQVSAGWTHACALTDGGAVYCWGRNPRFGDPVTRPVRHAAPTLVEGLPAVTQLASGNETSCALDADGQAWCFGSNVGVFNALQPDGGDWGPAVADAGGLRFTRLVMGGSTLCGLTADGGTYCWGGNLNGGLGRGFTSAQELVPAPPDGGGPYVEVASGQQHSCGRLSSGEVYCWGLIPPRSTLSAFLLSSTLRFSHLSAGTQFSCGLEASTSRARCWGQNGSAQCGVVSPTSISAPTLVSTTQPYFQLTAGSVHACAITDAGVGACWGLAGFGRLGNGSVTNSFAVPQPLFGNPLLTQVSAGLDFTCALARDNRILCWGYSGEGQLGPGTVASSRTFPIEVVR